MSATTSSAMPAATSGSPVGQGQDEQGIGILTLLSAMGSALAVFGVQMLVFILLKNKLARIFKPKTYLVPEKERTEPPPGSPWGWLFAIFQFKDREIINKCGLDAYFFLRYLQTLLVIFIPLALVIIPILVPLNALGGKNSSGSATTYENVSGLDQLAWGNVRPTKTHRYWAHLILAIFVIIWVCGVFFFELRVYIKVRQDYLTSAEHRLRASATTVLVSSIPQKWLSTKALEGLYDVFPGGIRNIWINRNFDELLDKIHKRDAIFLKLEAAETKLVREAKKAHKKQLEKDEKSAAKRSPKKWQPTKEEKVKAEDAEAERLARSGGVSVGDTHDVPHTVDEAINEEAERQREQGDEQGNTINKPLSRGALSPLGVVGRAGETVFGGLRNMGRGINDQVETTNGFMTIDRRSVVADDASFDELGNYRPRPAKDPAPFGSGAESKDSEKEPESPRRGDGPYSSSSEETRDNNNQDWRLPGNNVRKTRQDKEGYVLDYEPSKLWWQFWRAPSGAFASPLPTGWEDGDEFPLTQTSGTGPPNKAPKSLWAKIMSAVHSDSVVPIEYPLAYNPNYKEDAVGATWQRFLQKKDRPTHRLARFSWTPSFLPGLPLINKKVDTIYWCRGELARLNLEIEMDQKQPERFPLMNSAFIQFNHQVAAHMAAQAVTHHVPKQMAPRMVEISPTDVIWDNMSIKWWEGWIRTAVVTLIVTGMVILWAFPVAWSASLLQISKLSSEFKFLHFLNSIPTKVLQSISGVLPAVVLALLLWLVPTILNYLAVLQGAKTGVEKERSVQNYYFAFLFVQVFLVVSISGTAISTLGSTLTNITSIPNTLATELPKAANYFFSYMILQALSTSSGTLLQLVTLILWFVLPKIFDNTAREKWKRNTTLSTVSWGTFFPVYTNFACIALVYCVVTPIIIIFAIITFTLLWIANRYNMLYVSRFKLDTGGLLFPTAINQTFTGLYVMEICLVGLFFLVRDELGNVACAPQAIIMIVTIFLTIFYQYLLNRSFGPLLYHLPITFEDEAVIRDEVFERAQRRRLGLEDCNENENETSGLVQNDAVAASKNGDIEMTNLSVSPTQGSKFSNLKPVNIVQGAGSWALRSAGHIRTKTFGRGRKDDTTAVQNIHRKRKRPDIEAQQKIADALYGGYNDEVEDLTPEERDVLVKHAFQHYALRARRPTIWIPRDDIGVSDDEVRRTRDFAGQNIKISNIGAALDGKYRVVYGRNPPDFSEVDLITL